MKVFNRIVAVADKKVFKVIRIFVFIGLLCVIVEFLRFPKIYILATFAPQEVPFLYGYKDPVPCIFGYDIKPFENTFSYRIYLVKKLRKEHWDICLCFHCMCDYYRVKNGYYREDYDESEDFERIYDKSRDDNINDNKLNNK